MLHPDSITSLWAALENECKVLRSERRWSCHDRLRSLARRTSGRGNRSRKRDPQAELREADAPVLRILRRTLRESREVARREGASVRSICRRRRSEDAAASWQGCPQFHIARLSRNAVAPCAKLSIPKASTSSAMNVPLSSRKRMLRMSHFNWIPARSAALAAGKSTGGFLGGCCFHMPALRRRLFG